jgi:peptide/nickel transport system substrate-binding protein
MKQKAILKFSLILSIMLFAAIPVSFVFANYVPGLKTQDAYHTFIAGGTNPGAVLWLDPVASIEGWENRIQWNVVETLFEQNTTDPAFPLVPQLATNYSWEDFLTLVVDLRENVRFHDGTPFNASAVKWNFDRISYLVSQGLGSSITQGFVIPAVIFLGIPGVNISWFTGSMIPILNNTEVVSSHRVKFNLNVPFEPFVSILTTIPSGIISPTAHADYNESLIGIDVQKLVATGPFKFVSHSVVTLETKLVRNEDYWREPAYISDLIYTYFEDESTMYLAMGTGSIDFLHTPGPDFTIYNNSLCDILTGPPNPSYFSLIAMIEHNVNLTLRQAISQAIDYDYYINDYLEGKVVRIESVIMEGFKYHNPAIKTARYNLSAARELLISHGIAPSAASTWTDQDWIDRAESNPLVTLSFAYIAGVMDEIYTIISNDLKDIGIQLNALGLTTEQYLGALYDPGTRATLDMIYIDWGWADTDPGGYLLFMYMADAFMNFPFFNNSAAEMAMWGAFLSGNETEKQMLYDYVATIIHEDCPYVYLFQEKFNYIISSEWTGMELRIGEQYFYPVHRKQAEVPQVAIPGYSPYIIVLFSLGVIAIIARNRMKKK